MAKYRMRREDNMALRRLILHIGGGKTGSSFLQHCFASSVEKLRAAGVVYPHAESARDAIAGEATSGNAVDLAVFLTSETASAGSSVLHNLAGVLDEAAGLDVLFSSEGMQSFRPDNLKLVDEAARSRGYELIVVYYVRSAVGRAYSAYVQRVKKHLERRNFKQFLRSYSYPCAQIATYISQVLPASGYLIRNYDYARFNLYAHFAKAVLPAAAQAVQIKDRVVNRTLAPHEVEFMLRMNSLLMSEPQSAFVGRSLMNSHRNLTPIVVTQEEFDIIADANADKIGLLNRFLPMDEQVGILGPNETIGNRPSSTMSPTETAIVSVLAEVVRNICKAPRRN